MMTGLVLIIAELTLLYFISVRVIQVIYSLIYYLFHSRPVGMSIVSLIFFPGTVVHELSHLFTAEILGVRTGHLTLIPESIDSPPAGGDVKTGSVAIAKTDPFRRTLIGIAPLTVGVLALSTLSYVYQFQFVNNRAVTIIYYYLIFSISNSMFSSKEDMKGVWPVFLVLGLFVGAAYWVGFRTELTGQMLEIADRITDMMFRSLTLVLALNGIILLLFRLLIRTIRA